MKSVKEILLTQCNVSTADDAGPGDAPTLVFDRIVAACLDLEWQIMPRVRRAPADTLNVTSSQLGLQHEEVL